MSQNKEKIIQAYIQGLKEIVDLVQQADTLAQDYKSKFVNLNPNLAGTNITQGQIDAVNTFVNDLNNLATSTVATTINSKDVPSHGTEALN